MKKIDLICINIFSKQKSNLIILIIMIFMMFLINQSIGYARFLHLNNNIYNAMNDVDKLYWINLWWDKSLELNEAFKDADTDEEHLDTVKKEIVKLPHIIDISFIGSHQITGSRTIDVYGYDDSMIDMVNVLLKEGNTISSENMNEILISKELSDIYKLGDEIHINENNEITEKDTGHMNLKIAGIIDNTRFLPGMPYTENNNKIVCSYNLLEEYGIYSYLSNAVISTDENIDFSEIYNETSPELGFFTKFESYYNINGSIDYLIKNLTRQICILVICIVCISSLNFSGLYGKKYEYGIYFLCGARIKDIMVLTTSKNLIFILLSTVAGYIMTVQLSLVSEISNRIYDIGTYTISLFIALAIYFISSIPVYAELKTRNLIHLIKDVN